MFVPILEFLNCIIDLVANNFIKDLITYVSISIIRGLLLVRTVCSDTLPKNFRFFKITLSINIVNKLVI